MCSFPSPRSRPQGGLGMVSHRVIALVAFNAVLAAGAPGLAQESSLQIDPITVEAATADGYKADQSASPKFTAPLLDTPKSVTVITRDLMEERGATSLTDVLRTVPGITLGSGEGGTPVGDRPFIRGFEASTDIMVDGMRDLGRYSHESFNLEAVEITKGPGSAYIGRGSTGGSINLVTKTPKAETFSAGSLTLGSDLTKRATLDGNYRIAEEAAFRLNVMGHDGEVAGRDEVEVSRWGFAPSLTLGLNGPTRATFGYYHHQTDDIPDLGHPFDTSTGKPAQTGRDNYYGFPDRDFSKTRVDIGTVTLEHDLNASFTLRNSTRYGESELDYIMTRPTLNAATGRVNRDGRSRNSVTTSVINQTDMTGRFQTGFVEHNFITGVEFSHEKIRSRSYATPASPTTGLHDPNPHDPYGQPITRNDWGDPTKIRTAAIYLLDTAKLSEQWEVNLGLRFDDYKSESGELSNQSRFLDYQAGLVYKPVPFGSIYVAYATSSNPSGETQGQSGGADGAAGGGLGGNRVNLDPERNRSYEIGTKWDLFDRRLSVSGAIFRTHKVNQRATDPTTGDIELIGESRVDGVEVGVAGSITDRWKAFGGYTYLRGKLIDDGAGNNDGKELKYIAPHSFSVWSTYDVTSDLTFGGGASFVARRFVNDANDRELPSYWRLDAMASYRINENVGLRLNVLNLTDETIYDASHVGLFANVAPGRTALLTLDLKF